MKPTCLEHIRAGIGCSIVALCVVAVGGDTALAQNKPVRSKPPQFKPGEFEGVFFDDVSTALRGSLPSSMERVATVTQPNASAGGASTSGQAAATGSAEADLGGASGGVAWKDFVSPVSLEDLIKGSKLRLDRIVTTPAAFAGGGFQEARKEFSLQSLLFAIIETYPGDVRFKGSAGVARESMGRVAANTKGGSRQVYDVAKKRLADLEDLLNGTTLTGQVRSEITWGELIDRGPLMQLLEWAQQEYISPQTASEAAFSANKDELQRYAELVAVLGQVSTIEGMTDAEDEDYQAFAREMVSQAQQIVLAVQTNNAEQARQASGKLGQACSTCHENFR